ncbi:MAG TPA: cytochrome b [Xanthomonadales bacterium]|nr:cytochrome b [Xanthomonadales bacterium]
MNASNPARYGAWLIRLHWATLLLLVAVYACIELRELYPRGSAIRDGLKDWHYALGLFVFALVWVRLLVRLGARVPPVVPALPAWQAALAHAVHVALYAFMVVMPLLGWLALSAEGKPPGWFGFTLPALVGPNEALAEQVEEWHELIGTAGYWLVGLHAAAALLHHYVLRDDTLRRMLPGAPHRA